MTIDGARVDPRMMIQTGRPPGSGATGMVRRSETQGPRPITHATPGQAAEFASVLREQLAGVQFSEHARQRMQARAISLDATQLDRLHGALGALGKKGGKTSLVMLDDVSLVVSVPNRTVITAVREPEQAVFTNIDSAIKA